MLDQKSTCTVSLRRNESSGKHAIEIFFTKISNEKSNEKIFNKTWFNQKARAF